MSRSEERVALLADCAERLRALETEHGPTAAFARAATDEARALGERADLFGRDEFPLPPDGMRSQLHELAMGDDDRLAMYLHVIAEPLRVRPHDHTTWVVQVGVEGTEQHREYRRTDDGSVEDEATIEQIDAYEVGPSDVRVLLPESIHAVQIPAEQPTVSLSIYGLALHRLEGRVEFNPKNGQVRPMPMMPRLNTLT